MNPVLKLWRLAPLALLLLVACNKDEEGPPDSGPGSFEKTIELRGSATTAIDIAELTDGSLFVLGSAEPSTVGSQEQKMLGVKLTAAGDTLWTKRYTFGPASFFGYGIGYNCVATPDGNVAIAGISTAPGSTDYQALVAKLNGTTGAVLWRLHVPADIYSSVSKIVSTNDGGFLLLTKASSSSGYVVHRITALGTLAGTSTHAGYIASDICPTADGNFVVTGVQSTQYDVFLTKLTPQGTELWTRTPGATGFGLTNSVAQTADGGYAVASGNLYSNEERTIQLLKTDANGQQQFVKIVAPDIKGFAMKLAAGPDNSLVLVGAQTEKANGSVGFHPLALRVSATGSELARKAKPSVFGLTASFCKTSNGSLVLCSSEAGKLTIRRLQADLTE